MTEFQGRPDADDAVDLLRAHEPITGEEWTELLVNAGWGRADAQAFVRNGPEPYIVEFPDGRTVVMDRIADATVVTRRVTAAEIAADILADGPDLAVLTILRPNASVELPVLGDYAVFEERGAEELAESIEAGLILKRGTLARYRPGDLVGVRIGEGGAVSVEPVQTPVEADLGVVLTVAIAAGESVYVDDILHQEAWDHGLLCTPRLPVSELVENAGYGLDNGHVARSHADLETSRRKLRESMLAGVCSDGGVGLRLIMFGRIDPAKREEALRAALSRNPHAFDALGDYDEVADLLATIRPDEPVRPRPRRARRGAGDERGRGSRAPVGRRSACRRCRPGRGPAAGGVPRLLRAAADRRGQDARGAVDAARTVGVRGARIASRRGLHAP
ncbi:hypothetical protein [Tomitella fengzijianii]|uniref:Uncharacterized protein n=1 Tax=Tomitella fengzijianii TaxID=2597660 RepID=A0A516X212_9ACTN|nr:hypothetical protein [Tomitella fengzijianii]QDQ97122.1 hypothetical protein FO059_06960 [Tomitella fengzijianii]